MNQNPYAAPKSQVDVPVTVNGELLDPPQSRELGAAISWLSKGWALFVQAAGAWMLIALVFLLCYLVISFIPMGGLIIQILLPIVLAGLYIGADKLNFGEDIAVGQLFEGFSRNGAQLALVGLIGFVMQLVLAIVLLVPFFLIFGMTLFGSGSGKPDFGVGSMIGIVVLVLVGMAGSFVIALATWFAPMLVAMNNMEPVAAVKLSYAGGMRNLVPCIVFALIAMFLLVLGVVTIGLGMLLVFPLLCTSSYAAYREIFYGD